MPFQVCAYCGSTFPGSSRAKYCNWDCYSRFRKASSLGGDPDEEDEIILDPCKFNDGVRCPSQVGCAQCGWNPVVAQKRLDRILADRLGVEVKTDGG